MACEELLKFVSMKFPIFLLLSISGSWIESSPLTVLANIDYRYSLINSVDFHPQKNIFCAAYTHNNKVVFYEIDENHCPCCVQILQNPLAQLSEPQHAVFSPDGEKVVVANWTNQTLNVYLRKESGLFSGTPAAIIPTLPDLERCKPHGIVFSPCGDYLAIAYGAANYFEQAIALFRNRGIHFECISLLKNSELPGIPKGIAFSPDGATLLVTFCELNSLCIFNITNQMIDPIPKQMIGRENTGMSRPEDVKITPDGLYCAVTNSDQNTVTFYYFDQKSNSILQDTPCHTLRNPEAKLLFPHGIAFSRDGVYFAITQFGPVEVAETGDIFWNKKMKAHNASINLYLMSSETALSRPR